MLFSGTRLPQDSFAIWLFPLVVSFMAPKADELLAVPGGYVLIWNNLGGVSAEAGFVTIPALPVLVPVPMPIPLVPPALSVVGILLGHWWDHGYFCCDELNSLGAVSWGFYRRNLGWVDAW